MSVNENGNLVGVCKACNTLKKDSVVLPDWYKYLNIEQQEKLNAYMRYARSWISSHCTDEEVLEYIKSL